MQFSSYTHTHTHTHTDRLHHTFPSLNEEEASSETCTKVSIAPFGSSCVGVGCELGGTDKSLLGVWGQASAFFIY